jgi:hypothetical protein
MDDALACAQQVGVKQGNGVPRISRTFSAKQPAFLPMNPFARGTRAFLSDSIGSFGWPPLESRVCSGSAGP